MAALEKTESLLGIWTSLCVNLRVGLPCVNLKVSFEVCTFKAGLLGWWCRMRCDDISQCRTGMKQWSVKESLRPPEPIDISAVM